MMHASSAVVTYWNVALRPTGCVQVSQLVYYRRVSLAARASTYLHRLTVARPRYRVRIDRVVELAFRSRLVGYPQAQKCIQEGHIPIKRWSLYNRKGIIFLPATALEGAVIRELACNPFPLTLAYLSSRDLLRSLRQKTACTLQQVRPARCRVPSR